MLCSSSRVLFKPGTITAVLPFRPHRSFRWTAPQLIRLKARISRRRERDVRERAIESKFDADLARHFGAQSPLTTVDEDIDPPTSHPKHVPDERSAPFSTEDDFDITSPNDIDMSRGIRAATKMAADDTTAAHGGRSNSQSARSKRRLEELLGDEELAELFAAADVTPEELENGPDEAKSQRDKKQQQAIRKKNSMMVQKQVQFRLGKMPAKDIAATPASSPMESIDDTLGGAGTSIRQRRIGAAVQRTITESMARGDFGQDFVGLQIEIVNVEMGRGMRSAFVEWHTQGGTKDKHIERLIKSHMGRIRKVVANRMQLKFVPEFRFSSSDVRERELELDSLFAAQQREFEDYQKRTLEVDGKRR